MKAFIQLIIFILVIVVIVNIVIFFKDLEFGFSIDKLYRIPFVAMLGLGIFYLCGLYKIRAQRDEEELNRKVELEARSIMSKTEDYILKPALPLFLLLSVVFASLGVAPLYFGIKLLHEHHETATNIALSLLILFGLAFGSMLLHSFFLLIGNPVIRINQRGISHYTMDFIDWKEVAGVWLRTQDTQGGKQHSLEVSLKNPSIYQNKNKSLLGRFFKRELFSLYLPVSEEKARITEAVAAAFAARANGTGKF